jgi:hypothetical protein
MRKAIRDEKGNLVTDTEWNAILATANLVKMDLFALARNGKPRKKSYYRKYHRLEWSAAISKLEESLPLLKLCAAHWKAEHLLGSVLLRKVDKGACDDDDDNDDDDDDDDNDVNDDKNGTRILAPHHQVSKNARSLPLS